MPRLWEAMKDVISCDKLGGGANNLIPRFPNGETQHSEAVLFHYVEGERGELKHLSTLRRRKQK